MPIAGGQVIRALFAIALALVAAWSVIATAFVDAFAARQPAKAAWIWPGHPSVILASGLEQVGLAAAAGEKADPRTVGRMLAASAKAPLAPEPFLVRGVEQQLAGRNLVAGRAFLDARRRDPRSVAARYFLADHYLKSGQTRLGLREVSALARLVPQSIDALAPQLAAFARTPGAAPAVKAMLRDHPILELNLLRTLAADAANSRLILALWNGQRDDDHKIWQRQLVSNLVEAGRFDEARSAWLRFEPRPDRRGALVDPDFSGSALPPFGWAFESGASGVAEPEGAGRLHVIYYGRENVSLARQLLTLGPGNYRLSMRVDGAGPAAKSLAWGVRCLPSGDQIGSLNVSSARRGALVGDFAVPTAGCRLQRLELAGSALEMPQQADISLSGLRLERR